MHEVSLLNLRITQYKGNNSTYRTDVAADLVCALDQGSQPSCFSAPRSKAREMDVLACVCVDLRYIVVPDEVILISRK